MKIPNKVKVGAHTYKVTNRDASGESDGRFGHVRSRTLQIYIDDRTSKSQQEDTFFHEILHAICGNTHLFEDEKEEERVVQALGHGIYEVLIDNKLLK